MTWEAVSNTSLSDKCSDPLHFFDGRKLGWQEQNRAVIFSLHKKAFDVLYVILGEKYVEYWYFLQ